MLLDKNELNKLERCAKSGQYTPEGIAILKKLIDVHLDLRSLLKDPDTSLDDVYRYLGRDENQPSPDRPAGDRRASPPDASDA
jgi:hypothetical protein